MNDAVNGMIKSSAAATATPAMIWMVDRVFVDIGSLVGFVVEVMVSDVGGVKVVCDNKVLCISKYGDKKNYS
jgi:hypothetical protein